VCASYPDNILAQAEEQSVKFNCQQIFIEDQLSASVIGQAVAGARLVSRRHRSRSRTFAGLALQDADHQRLKWATRIVGTRERTVTFANADPEESP
jgi:selenophosphate synthetase-related protein